MTSAGPSESEQQKLIAMLAAAHIAHTVVMDEHDPDQCSIVIKNKFLNRDARVDVVFQFRNQNLDRMWVR